MVQKRLQAVPASQVKIFKIKNRRGYAAICLKNLTEGKSAAEAFQRLRHPLRRMGKALPDRMPAVR